MGIKFPLGPERLPANDDWFEVLKHAFRFVSEARQRDEASTLRSARDAGEVFGHCVVAGKRLTVVCDGHAGEPAGPLGPLAEP
jgi:hypothetical protein